jgi:hypothetical protein
MVENSTDLKFGDSKEFNDKSNKPLDKDSTPSCCIGCVRWEKFGKNCYYFWEGKKHCTMWTSNWDQA